jgi:hypothetical protein
MKTPNITVLEVGKIQIAAFDCALGRVAKATIGLAPFAGETVRIWLDENKKYSTDKLKNHYWQVAELTVPAQQYSETEGVDGDGNPTQIREAIPIDLSNAEILLWDLPE